MTRTRLSPLGLELAVSAALVLALLPWTTQAAPWQDITEIQQYTEGCYYNYNHYNEGDRILTNEPCLNCTCHNRMLMCYLRVCPFTKPIGHDCVVEKREDQCCPIITCPEVPVDIAHASPELGTDLSIPEKYGCSIDQKFYPEGAQVPSNPNKPCELCYCIRNRTSCLMQECTLHIESCTPIYNKGSCCPVRYNCDHENDVLDLENHSTSTTTTVRPTPGFVLTTTASPSVITDCVHNGVVYADGASLRGKNPCEHCYCMRGDIVCAVQECEMPMLVDGKSCHPLPASEGECCPSNYVCTGDSTTTEIVDTATVAYIDGGVELPTGAPHKDLHSSVSEEDLQLQTHIDDNGISAKEPGIASQSKPDEEGSGDLITESVSKVDVGAAIATTAMDEVEKDLTASDKVSSEQHSESGDIMGTTTSKIVLIQTTSKSAENVSGTVTTTQSTVDLETSTRQYDQESVENVSINSATFDSTTLKSDLPENGEQMHKLNRTGEPLLGENGMEVPSIDVTTEKLLSSDSATTEIRGLEKDYNIIKTEITDAITTEDYIDSTTASEIPKLSEEENVTKKEMELSEEKLPSLENKHSSTISSVVNEVDMTTSLTEHDLGTENIIYEMQSQTEGKVYKTPTIVNETKGTTTESVPTTTVYRKGTVNTEDEDGLTFEEKVVGDSHTTVYIGDENDITITTQKALIEADKETDKNTELNDMTSTTPPSEDSEDGTTTMFGVTKEQENASVESEENQKEISAVREHQAGELEHATASTSTETSFMEEHKFKDIISSTESHKLSHEIVKEFTTVYPETAEPASDIWKSTTSPEDAETTAALVDSFSELSTRSTFQKESVTTVSPTDGKLWTDNNSNLRPHKPHQHISQEQPTIATTPSGETNIKISVESVDVGVEITTNAPDVGGITQEQVTERLDLDDESETETIPALIPGEGDCLHEQITYKNNSFVPNYDECNVSCKCLSSIVVCQRVQCKTPEEITNCILNTAGTDKCCPEYICGTETMSTAANIDKNQEVKHTFSEAEEAITVSSYTEDLTKEKASSSTPVTIPSKEVNDLSTHNVPSDIDIPTVSTEEPMSQFKDDMDEKSSKPLVHSSDFATETPQSSESTSENVRGKPVVLDSASIGYDSYTLTTDTKAPVTQNLGISIFQTAVTSGTDKPEHSDLDDDKKTPLIVTQFDESDTQGLKTEKSDNPDQESTTIFISSDDLSHPDGNYAPHGHTKKPTLIMETQTPSQESEKDEISSPIQLTTTLNENKDKTTPSGYEGDEIIDNNWASQTTDINFTEGNKVLVNKTVTHYIRDTTESKLDDTTLLPIYSSTLESIALTSDPFHENKKKIQDNISAGTVDQSTEVDELVDHTTVKGESDYTTTSENVLKEVATYITKPTPMFGHPTSSEHTAAPSVDDNKLLIDEVLSTHDPQIEGVSVTVDEDLAHPTDSFSEDENHNITDALDHTTQPDDEDKKKNYHTILLSTSGDMETEIQDSKSNSEVETTEKEVLYDTTVHIINSSTDDSTIKLTDDDLKHTISSHKEHTFEDTTAHSVISSTSENVQQESLAQTTTSEGNTEKEDMGSVDDKTEKLDPTDEGDMETIDDKIAPITVPSRDYKTEPSVQDSVTTAVEKEEELDYVDRKTYSQTDEEMKKSTVESVSYTTAATDDHMADINDLMSHKIVPSTEQPTDELITSTQNTVDISSETIASVIKSESINKKTVDDSTEYPQTSVVENKTESIDQILVHTTQPLIDDRTEISTYSSTESNNIPSGEILDNITASTSSPFIDNKSGESTISSNIYTLSYETKNDMGITEETLIGSEAPETDATPNNQILVSNKGSVGSTTEYQTEEPGNHIISSTLKTEKESVNGTYYPESTLPTIDLVTGETSNESTLRSVINTDKANDEIIGDSFTTAISFGYKISKDPILSPEGEDKETTSSTLSHGFDLFTEGITRKPTDESMTLTIGIINEEQRTTEGTLSQTFTSSTNGGINPTIHTTVSESDGKKEIIGDNQNVISPIDGNIEESAENYTKHTAVEDETKTEGGENKNKTEDFGDGNITEDMSVAIVTQSDDNKKINLYDTTGLTSDTSAPTIYEVVHTTIPTIVSEKEISISTPSHTSPSSTDKADGSIAYTSDNSDVTDKVQNWSTEDTALYTTSKFSEDKKDQFIDESFIIRSTPSPLDVHEESIDESFIINSTPTVDIQKESVGNILPHTNASTGYGEEEVTDGSVDHTDTKTDGEVDESTEDSTDHILSNTVKFTDDDDMDVEHHTPSSKDKPQGSTEVSLKSSKIPPGAETEKEILTTVPSVDEKSKDPVYDLIDETTNTGYEAGSILAHTPSTFFVTDKDTLEHTTGHVVYDEEGTTLHGLGQTVHSLGQTVPSSDKEEDTLTESLAVHTVSPVSINEEVPLTKAKPSVTKDFEEEYIDEAAKHTTTDMATEDNKHQTIQEVVEHETSHVVDPYTEGIKSEYYTMNPLEEAGHSDSTVADSTVTTVPSNIRNIQDEKHLTTNEVPSSLVTEKPKEISDENLNLNSLPPIREIDQMFENATDLLNESEKSNVTDSLNVTPSTPHKKDDGSSTVLPGDQSIVSTTLGYAQQYHIQEENTTVAPIAVSHPDSAESVTEPEEVVTTNASGSKIQHVGEFVTERVEEPHTKVHINTVDGANEDDRTPITHTESSNISSSKPLEEFKPVSPEAEKDNSSTSTALEIQNIDDTITEANKFPELTTGLHNPEQNIETQTHKQTHSTESQEETDEETGDVTSNGEEGTFVAATTLHSLSALHSVSTTPEAILSFEDEKRTSTAPHATTNKDVDEVSITTSTTASEAPTTTSTSTTQYPQPPAIYGQSPQYPSYPEDEYTDEDEAEVFGPGTCRYGGKLFVSAQQIPRDDPCDFCFCFRSDIICLQQSCPPPISGCHEEPINGFCCPRYECPVSMATVLNITTSTTTTSTTLPPHFLHHAYEGAAQRNGCLINGKSYRVGQKIDSTSGPCMHCTCGGDGQMKCDPKTCSPEPMLRQMIAVVASRRR